MLRMTAGALRKTRMEKIMGKLICLKFIFHVRGKTCPAVHVPQYDMPEFMCDRVPFFIGAHGVFQKQELYILLPVCERP